MRFIHPKLNIGLTGWGCTFMFTAVPFGIILILDLIFEAKSETWVYGIGAGYFAIGLILFLASILRKKK